MEAIDSILRSILILCLRIAKELPRHFDLAIFQVVRLFDVLHGQLVWCDEHKVQDDEHKIQDNVSSPEAADV
jgi:hypothetical protein